MEVQLPIQSVFHIPSLLHAVATDTVVAAAQSIALIGYLLTNVPNSLSPNLTSMDGRFPLEVLLRRKHVYLENKNGSETEDDEDGDDDDEGHDDDDDGEDEEFSGEEGDEEADPEDDPEANGEGSDDGDEDDDDEDGDEEDDDDGEGEEEDEEEDEEEETQPPSKKRK